MTRAQEHALLEVLLAVINMAPPDAQKRLCAALAEMEAENYERLADEQDKPKETGK